MFWVGDGGEGARFMRLEANPVEPGAVHFIITRHAYTKSPRKEPGEDGDEVIYISGGTGFVSRRKDSFVSCLASLEAQ